MKSKTKDELKKAEASWERLLTIIDESGVVFYEYTRLKRLDLDFPEKITASAKLPDDKTITVTVTGIMVERYKQKETTVIYIRHHRSDVMSLSSENEEEVLYTTVAQFESGKINCHLPYILDEGATDFYKEIITAAEKAIAKKTS